MNILDVIDPIKALTEANRVKETSIQAVIARVKSGKPINSQMVKTITNDQGQSMTYDQALQHVPRDMQTPQLLGILRQATNEAEIGQDPNVGENAFGQRVMK
jgi:hypothetical protein